MVRVLNTCAGAGAGDGDGAVDVVDCDMLGGGGRVLLMDCDGY